MTNGPTMADAGRDLLRRRVESWAERLRVRPRLVRLRRMTRKWGSCSTGGVVTLAADLHDQPPDFQDFVIAHELLHLRIPNHGKLFRAVLAAHFPDLEFHDACRPAPRPKGGAVRGPGRRRRAGACLGRFRWIDRALRELEGAPGKAAAEGLPEILPATIGEARRLLYALQHCRTPPVAVYPTEAGRIGIDFDSRADHAAVHIEVGNDGSGSFIGVSPVPDCRQYRGPSSDLPNDLLWERLRWLDERPGTEETE